MLTYAGDNEDNRLGKSAAAGVQKAAALRLSLKSTSRKKSNAKSKDKMNPRHLNSGYVAAVSGINGPPELVWGLQSVDNTPLVTPTDLEFEIVPQINDAKTDFGGSNYRNEVARRSSILNDSNIPGYILHNRAELHCGKPTRLYANEDEDKENRPPTRQTLPSITDFPSPPPAPRIDSGTFDFHHGLPHSTMFNSNANTGIELELALDSFADMSLQRNFKNDKSSSNQFIAMELERPHTDFGLDVAQINIPPRSENCELARESALMVMDYPRAPRPDMGAWSADWIEEAVLSAPVRTELPHAKRSRSESAFSLASFAAQSQGSRGGTGTGDRSSGWDTGLGLTLEMVADSDAEFSEMNFSLGDTSVDNSLSLYTPESSFFRSSNGVIEESMVGLFPPMARAGAGSRLEMDAPPTDAPVEDKLLGLGIGSSSRRTQGTWSCSSAAAEEDTIGPTRRFALGLSRLDKSSFSRVDKPSRRTTAATPLPHRMWATAASGSSVRATAAAHRHNTHAVHHGTYIRETVPGRKMICETDRRTCSHSTALGEHAHAKNTEAHAIAYASNNGDRSRDWTLLPPIDLDH
eukprot:TRINITY_DN5723_c0_g1_i1.p1 TRINITY_DN5723_c0_g1~~TRINITY_DN5723_c0_g1_i1.p1  ORF type:complete len:579 (-),score=18.11 TRINITY_DN5723_c0_g1_i1:297-2033(-)